MTEPRASSWLLDRDIPEASLREQTAKVAVQAAVIKQGTKSLVVFRLGLEWLALPTEVFQEVAEECRVHTLPHRSGRLLSGLVNVRGELLLCVALDVLLGLGPADEEKSGGSGGKQPHVNKLRPYLLICNRGGDRFAFSVSEVGGIHRYSVEDQRDAPATLSKSAGGSFTLGMVMWRGKSVGCLDDELVFRAVSKNLA